MPGLDDFQQEFEDDLNDAMGPIMHDAAQAGVRLSSNDMAVWNLVNQGARDWADKYTYSLVKGISQTTVDHLRAEITDWIDSGEHLNALVERIDQATLFGPVRAEAIATTEVTRAFSVANILAWGQDPAVEGKVWQTAEDELVCPICGPLAGQVVGIRDLFNSAQGHLEGPPAHVRCRCWLKPWMGRAADPAHPLVPTASTPPVWHSAVAPSVEEIERAILLQKEQHAWFYDYVEAHKKGLYQPAENTVAALSDQLGVSPDAIVQTLAEWNDNSNGVAMLQFQRDTGEVLGADLSKWQRQLWTNRTDPNEIEDRIMGDLRRAGYNNISEFNQDLAKAIYADTQAVLEEAGVDELIVFRGIDAQHPAVRRWYEEGLEAGASVPIEDPNVLESWTFNRKTAQGAFSGNNGATLAMRVPRERVFSTFSTGFGTGDEDEIVLFNPAGVSDRATLVSLKTSSIRAAQNGHEVKAGNPRAINFAEGGMASVDWIKHVGDGGKATNEAYAQALAHIEDVLAKWGWEL